MFAVTLVVVVVYTVTLIITLVVTVAILVIAVTSFTWPSAMCVQASSAVCLVIAMVLVSVWMW